MEVLEDGHRRSAPEDKKSDQKLIEAGKIVPYLINLIDSPGMSQTPHHIMHRFPLDWLLTLLPLCCCFDFDDV